MSLPASLPAEALPPWLLTAESYMFFGWSWTPQLPRGSFHPAEKEALLAASSSDLARTPYCINIYRYKTGPVGPYDEITFIPGFFKTSVKDSYGNITTDHSPRVTRIYVSTEASIYNGRKNWNIPKHKADFTFDYQPNGDIAITVKSPHTGEAFFAATVTPSKRWPSFKMKTDWLPISLDLLQPPLPAVDDIATSTSAWQKTPFSIEQKNAQVAYIKPALDIAGKSGGAKVYADGENFPNIAPYSAGLYCKDAIIDFKKPITPQVEALSSSEGGSGGVKLD
ncbi:hypothetical protein P389DRAFT_174718 [Cystobasidium minutum MCA 4210]|uniref:uncharacterized protein n=1 Tax=Cystobasidium minutum MCA 4210 TaxID=1397322 RepID=UPI0034CF5C9A|eukprot:jgi/Rhomi1/174718/fgenesh1_kg.8_\